MLGLDKGRVVLSLAGKDKGRLMVIVANSDRSVLLADGKHHPLENPKCKNIRHISATERVLDSSEMATNRRLRKALSPSESQQR